MRNVAVFIIYLFVSLQIFPADGSSDLFKRGNELYREKQYKEALEIYNQLIEKGFEDDALYYNTGNAYYRVGQIGLAVLYYEKALKLNPGDEDIRHNLALANTKTIDNIETLPGFFIFDWWEGLLAAMPLSGWTYLSYALFVILIASIGFYFFAGTAKSQKVSVITALTVLIMTITSAVITGVKLNREENLKKGIITAGSVTVKQSPDEKSGDAFIIHEGLKVKLEDELDNWIKIKLPDGKLGWLKKNSVEVI